jgi:hypothetical protein
MLSDLRAKTNSVLRLERPESMFSQVLVPPSDVSTLQVRRTILM